MMLDIVSKQRPHLEPVRPVDGADHHDGTADCRHHEPRDRGGDGVVLDERCGEDEEQG